MGVSVQDLAFPRARSLDVELMDYDLSDCKVVWLVLYRNPEEQGGKVGQWTMKIRHYLFGLPTTAPYHIMAICDSEEKARSMCQDENWTIGPIEPNKCFPLKRVNWKRHYSPKAFLQLNPESGEVDMYQLISTSELLEMKEVLSRALNPSG